MFDVALEHGEDAGRRGMTGPACRNGGDPDRDAVSVYHGALGGEAHHHSGPSGATCGAQMNSPFAFSRSAAATTEPDPGWAGKMIAVCTPATSRKTGNARSNPRHAGKESQRKTEQASEGSVPAGGTTSAPAAME